MAAPKAVPEYRDPLNKLGKEDKAAFSEAGAKLALPMRELWNKRVALAP